jgi:hypothetical protein
VCEPENLSRIWADILMKCASRRGPEHFKPELRHRKHSGSFSSHYTPRLELRSAHEGGKAHDQSKSVDAYLYPSPNSNSATFATLRHFEKGCNNSVKSVLNYSYIIKISTRLYIM